MSMMPSGGQPPPMQAQPPMDDESQEMCTCPKCGYQGTGDQFMMPAGGMQGMDSGQSAPNTMQVANSPDQGMPSMSPEEQMASDYNQNMPAPRQSDPRRAGALLKAWG